MPLWRLSPVARHDDPHWKAYEYQGPLLVEAAYPAAARVKGTVWYKSHFQSGPEEDEDQFYRSAFEDHKLYKAIELTPEMAAQEIQKYPLASSESVKAG